MISLRKAAPLFVALLFCIACKSQIERDIETTRADLASFIESKSNLEDICNSHRVTLNRALGSKAKAELDIAIAENVDDATHAQEWEFRRMVAAESGVLPSEANGWKSVLKGRASNARYELVEIEEKIKRASEDADFACGNLKDAERGIIESKSKLRALIAEARQP